MGQEVETEVPRAAEVGLYTGWIRAGCARWSVCSWSVRSSPGGQ
ncbi:hypothetical protein IEO21_07589 [Rhodonia placenta]|uniref:Uncharacterized protein n=1 Tax=Rhodonia placenta TaxID=104341 RepID=A0A8H7NXV4_9APHY|nr:hypothetical protein IEO21_07589 [Postia placenta]